jgi:hypothetical protein
MSRGEGRGLEPGNFLPQSQRASVLGGLIGGALLAASGALVAALLTLALEAANDIRRMRVRMEDVDGGSR